MLKGHVPVLAKEVIEFLQVGAGKNFIDCTYGGGGHSRLILEATKPNGQVLAIDLDPDAAIRAKPDLVRYSGRLNLIIDNFSRLKQIKNEFLPVHQINGILFDLGISSIELEDKNRGFSFKLDSPLDMRFDKRQSLTAAEIVNKWPPDELKKIIQEYGQENLAQEITKQILLTRRKQKIIKTKILVEAILLAYRKKLGSKKLIPWVGGHHPATKTFQALRIAVNRELENLKLALPQALDILAVGGRLVVISFHSLEDKIVKDFLKREEKNCICPPELPVCCCGHRAKVKIITKKPVIPSVSEIKQNFRSRSAKLRAAEKIRK